MLIAFHYKATFGCYWCFLSWKYWLSSLLSCHKLVQSTMNCRLCCLSCSPGRLDIWIYLFSIATWISTVFRCLEFLFSLWYVCWYTVYLSCRKPVFTLYGSALQFSKSCLCAAQLGSLLPLNRVPNLCSWPLEYRPQFCVRVLSVYLPIHYPVFSGGPASILRRPDNPMFLRLVLSAENSSLSSGRLTCS